MLKIPFALISVFETTCKPDKYAFLKNRSKRNKVDTHTHTHSKRWKEQIQFLPDC